MSGVGLVLSFLLVAFGLTSLCLVGFGLAFAAFTFSMANFFFSFCCCRVLVIGEVEHIVVADEAVDAEGHIDLNKTNSVGISGLNSYYQFEKLAQFPYARLEELPVFEG